MRFAADSKGNRYRIHDDGRRELVVGEAKEPSCCGNAKPSVKTMTASLIESAAIWAKNGFALLDEEDHEKRFSICKTCDELYDGGRCRKCGCFMEVKSKLAGMKCPINKW